MADILVVVKRLEVDFYKDFQVKLRIRIWCLTEQFRMKMTISVSNPGFHRLRSVLSHFQKTFKKLCSVEFKLESCSAYLFWWAHTFLKIDQSAFNICWTCWLAQLICFDKKWPISFRYLLDVLTHSAYLFWWAHAFLKTDQSALYISLSSWVVSVCVKASKLNSNSCNSSTVSKQRESTLHFWHSRKSRESFSWFGSPIGDQRPQKSYVLSP